jgi:hypothetical protein
MSQGVVTEYLVSLIAKQVEESSLVIWQQKDTHCGAGLTGRVGLWRPRAMVIFEDEKANRSYPKQATIHRSNGEWTMSRLKASPPNWKRPTVAASLVVRRPPVWKSRCGFARSKTVVGWTPRHDRESRIASSCRRSVAMP